MSPKDNPLTSSLAPRSELGKSWNSSSMPSTSRSSCSWCPISPWAHAAPTQPAIVARSLLTKSRTTWKKWPRSPSPWSSPPSSTRSRWPTQTLSKIQTTTLTLNLTRTCSMPRLEEAFPASWPMSQTRWKSVWCKLIMWSQRSSWTSPPTTWAPVLPCSSSNRRTTPSEARTWNRCTTRTPAWSTRRPSWIQRQPSQTNRW